MWSLFQELWPLEYKTQDRAGFTCTWNTRNGQNLTNTYAIYWNPKRQSCIFLKLIWTQGSVLIITAEVPLSTAITHQCSSGAALYPAHCMNVEQSTVTKVFMLIKTTRLSTPLYSVQLGSSQITTQNQNTLNNSHAHVQVWTVMQAKHTEFIFIHHADSVTFSGSWRHSHPTQCP